jgi:hypothetical protein
MISFMISVVPPKIEFLAADPARIGDALALAAVARISKDEQQDAGA